MSERAVGDRGPLEVDPTLGPPAPARLGSARTGPLLGAVLLVVVLAVVGGTLVFAYAYLAANAEQWRPDGSSGPDAVEALVVVVGALVAALAASVSCASSRAGDETAPALVGSVATAVTGLLATGALWWSLEGLAGGPDESAFWASTHVLGWYGLGLLAMGSAGAVLVAGWVLRGHRTDAVRDSLRALRLYWWSTAAMVAVLVATIGLGGGWV